MPIPRAIGVATFGILALELALIRWTSSQVRIFAYFNNIVLICSFSVVFAGVLIMVLIGNALVLRRQWSDPRPWIGALLGAVLVLFFVPLGWLHALPLVMRGIISGLHTGLPVGSIAGIIVPMFLARAPDPASALGTNLLGAVLGGCLEHLAMFTGPRAMAWLALVLYFAAYLWCGRMRVSREAAAAPDSVTAMSEL